jgi:hypothetical protein
MWFTNEADHNIVDLQGIDSIRELVGHLNDENATSLCKPPVHQHASVGLTHGSSSQQDQQQEDEFTCHESNFTQATSGLEALCRGDVDPVLHPCW